MHYESTPTITEPIMKVTANLGSVILPVNSGHGTKSPVSNIRLNFATKALKLAERIGVAAAARELSLCESQLYARRSKLKNAHSSSEREQEMAVEIARLKRQLAEELAIIQKAASAVPPHL